jgi:ATP-dependent DNA ligase
MFTVRTFVQPKLDGVRCYMTEGLLMSRKGTEIVSCPHLKLMQGLDGELYNHDLKNDFNKIISLTRKTKPTLEEIQEAANKVQFWVYDYPEYNQLVFSERYEILKNSLSSGKYQDKIKLVPTYEITSMEELKVYHEQFIEEGYEGSIIRMDLGGYENKRSKQLLKKKDWQDAEFKIIDVLEGEGNRAGCANMLVIEVSDGIICKPTMTGTEEYMRHVWQNKDFVIGKEVTVKYFGYTPDGNLRFPTVKAIRDYE